MATVSSNWERVIPLNAPPFYVFKTPLQKSMQDDREYRVIRLENSLEAVLVHDPTADKAAASLDVAVGHLQDPDDMPGLAHFCEHLLFMGTKEFPRENEYSQFLTKNNGAANAYTSSANTNYYFSVAAPALSQALSRFAGLFHSPLFDPSCTLREINAVNSENKKNLQMDSRRIHQLRKHLSVEGHPWRKFGTGNLESLTAAAKRLLGETADDAVGEETRRRLIEWWSKEYCASRMRLCILGDQSLDDLATLASTLFSPILNRGVVPLPMLTTSPMGPDQTGTLVAVKTIKTYHALDISFPVEWQDPLWQHKPMRFLSHFVGHEGPGSIHSYLKSKGWITSLSSSSQSISRGLSAFKVSVSLTIQGFQNHRQVALTIFKYLTLLRDSRFASFHQREQAVLSATRFQFKEKGDARSYATWIAENMNDPIPRELLLSAPSLVWDWDGEEEGSNKVRDYLDHALRVENARIVLLAKEEEEHKQDVVWEKEPWYGTEYYVEKFDEMFIEEAQGPNDIQELYLPGPNQFIPTNVQVDKMEVAEPLKAPLLIRETPLSALWHKKDDKYWIPKAHVKIHLRSPFVYNSARAAVMTRLYSAVVDDALEEFSYDASLGMLHYSISTRPTGLYISMSGFNDKLAILAKHVLDKLKTVVVDPARLEVKKEQVKKGYENFFLEQSRSLANHYLDNMLTQRVWSLESRLEELPSITAEELQQHIKLVLSEVHLKMLVTGNLSKDEALEIADMVEEGLSLCTLSLSELNRHALIPSKGSNHTWASTVPNPKEPNSALSYYVHLGSILDERLRVTSSLLVQILREPAFNVLRTKEQLGYIVSCSTSVLTGDTEKGMRIVVQSEKTPGYLEDRVEAFLESMKSVIEDMTPEVFEEHKESLRKGWTEAEKNLGEETSRFWAHVVNGQEDFLRKEKNAEIIQDVTKEEVLELFLFNVHPASTTRAKLSIHMLSQKHPASQDLERTNVTYITDVETFKKSLGVSVDCLW
ncbi:Metalloenzyme, LuxS/M16 peptidase-like protein [Roridomyces roridus]|uniref:Metalloenzyme, LuxS/M16 peptidase-like protein n=1 Tax=Roridomyces roridus TaxID=1738132 RepID=A0AAD7FP29_9AGAR|nr:Metalloenzyme, LuxS/M16 peptidase-like protein [Roridomyces roridus]